jgi:ABC-2 type transport system permease protein
VKSTLQLRERPFGLAAAGHIGAFAQSVRIGAEAALGSWQALLGRAVLYVIVVAIFGYFWSAVVAEHVADTWAAYLPPSGFAVYVGTTEWIALSIPAIHLRIEADFRSQDIEAHLLRPKSYLALRAGEAFGALVARMAILGVTAGIMLQFADAGRPPAEVYGYLLVLGPLAGLIAILQYAVVGLCGFWMRRVQSAFLLVQKSGFLLGGLVAPITLYPEWLRKICETTPFAAQFYMPAILTVHASEKGALSTFGIELFWIFALAGVAGAFWRAGLTAVLERGA